MSGLLHGQEPTSSWVARWSHLLPAGCSVLDLACGHGRHMRHFAALGHSVTGVDRNPDAIAAVSPLGEAICADIENGPWPLQDRIFGGVVVTNYLWRALFPVIAQSVAPGGLLIYETFATGNETVGKPSRPDFLLQPAELLTTFQGMRLIAFEDGFLDNPPRFVQRIAAVRDDLTGSDHRVPKRYPL